MRKDCPPSTAGGTVLVMFYCAKECGWVMVGADPALGQVAWERASPGLPNPAPLYDPAAVVRVTTTP